MPAKDSISASVRRGLPSTAADTMRFGSRTRMARSLARPLEGRDHLLGGVQPVDALDDADLLVLPPLVLGEVVRRAPRPRWRAPACSGASETAIGSSTGGRLGGGRPAAASGRPPMWKVSRSSRRRRFWSLLRFGFDLEGLEQRRPAQQPYLVDDDQLRQLRGKERGQGLDGVVGGGRVLERRLRGARAPRGWTRTQARTPVGVSRSLTIGSISSGGDPPKRGGGGTRGPPPRDPASGDAAARRGRPA